MCLPGATTTDGCTNLTFKIAMQPVPVSVCGTICPIRFGFYACSASLRKRLGCGFDGWFGNHLLVSRCDEGELVGRLLSTCDTGKMNGYGKIMQILRTFE